MKESQGKKTPNGEMATLFTLGRGQPVSDTVILVLVSSPLR